MSLEESIFCSSPVPIALPTAPVSVPSSSRPSSGSSLHAIGLANDSPDGLADIVPLTSSSQSSLPRRSSDVMPQADGSGGDSGTSTPDIDPQIIEALKSKDRLFVLKLGEQMEALIREKNSRSKITLSPVNQYQRLLVHRCAAYFRLMPENDPMSRDKSGVRDMIVTITMESRLPYRRISELVPAEQISHPTFKIMRRTEQDRRRQKSSISRPSSAAGEDGELSDPGPSESGSMGSRSTTSKKRMTIAEREAAYEKARSRIFMNFEEKEKAKERDTSASSSTLSLASASGSGSQSGGACCSISDIDDNASTAPTESEWSVPGTDRRRGVDSGSADSTRSFPSYNTQGPGNERVSGTASPSFTYPSLYEPPVHMQGYEQSGHMPPSGGYVSAPFPMYFAHQPPPNMNSTPATSPPYIAPYQYFPQYPYTSPPPQPPPHPSSDPSSPASGPSDGYSHHVTGMVYMGPNTYGWMPSPNQQHRPPSETQSPPRSGHVQVQSPPVHGVPPMSYPYAPYMAPHSVIPYAGYPPYFQPPPQTHPHVVHPHSQPVYPVELPPTNGNGPERGTSSGMSSGNGSPSPTLSRHTSSSGSSKGYQNHMNGALGNNCGAPPTRGIWSYGPGMAMHPNVSNPGTQSGPGVGEPIGPRLTSAMRRTSGVSSSSSGYRTPGDETASVASSSTSSSSSRRTYNNMSTPSKHPLPPRPDWAAGLKAQPTLHPPVRHRHDSNNSRTMSPARPPALALQNQQPITSQQRPPIHLQPADFPPLSSVSNAPSEKRPPAGSAWSNTSPAARAVLSPNPGHSNQTQGNTYGSALFNHANVNRLEEDERGFERPPPKTNTELFNPKGGAKRPAQSQSPSQQPQSQAGAREGKPGSTEHKIEKDNTRGEAVACAILIDKTGSLKIQTRSTESEVENTPKAASLLSGLPRELKFGSVDNNEGAGSSFAEGDFNT